jgi:hypothetical protein
MNLLKDSAKYEALQNRMLDEILVTIRDGLINAGLKDAQALSEATWNLAFDIACIVDGSRNMKVDGVAVLPVLTFATEQKYSTLIHEQGGSWLHESIDQDAVEGLCGLDPQT